MKIKSLDIFFIFFVLILFSLGTWQTIRLNHKNNLIENLENNLKKNSIYFNSDISKEYTKVLIKKKSLKPEVFLYHLNKGEIGFKVIVPYEVNNSLIVLVDKGWVKKDKINLIKKGLFNEDVIEGYTKKIKEKGLFTPDNNNKEDFTYFIDINFLKTNLNKNIYPLLIIQTSKTNKDIAANNYQIHLSNNHLQYAITWYGLALVTIIFFLYYRKKV
ncbi:MAG: SURF1 family protein [Pseudomonadota bacterium]